MPRSIWIAAGVLLALVTGMGCSPRSAPPVTVFAAASLTDALTEIATDYGRDTGVRVRLSFGSSGALARQIEAGAPADVVILADRAWMLRLSRSGRLVEAPGALLGNRLVMIAPAAAAVGPDPLSALGKGNRLAIGDPDSVPAGAYAKAWLEGSGRWSWVQSRVVYGADVRAVRAFVARGEAALGIVYRSDAVGQDAVRAVLEPAPDQYPEIVYPAAAVRGASNQALDFLDHLRSPAAAAVFERYGFEPLA